MGYKPWPYGLGLLGLLASANRDTHYFLSIGDIFTVRLTNSTINLQRSILPFWCDIGFLFLYYGLVNCLQLSTYVE